MTTYNQQKAPNTPSAGHAKITSPNTQRFSFTVYGHAANVSKPALGFAGYRYDALTDGYSPGYGYRIYKPQLMRFASADILSPFGHGGINAYAYAQGDPINFIDPSGHNRIPVQSPPLNGRWRITHEVKNMKISVTSTSTRDNTPGVIVFAGGSAGRVQLSNKSFINAYAFVETLSEAGIDLTKAPLLLVSPDSANVSFFGKRAIAQKISNLIKQPVYAYKGPVGFAIGTRSGRTYGSVVTENKSPIGSKAHRTFNHVPVTFMPDENDHKDYAMRIRHDLAASAMAP